MEVDFLDVDAVGQRFGFAERLKDAAGGGFDGLGEVGGRDHFQNGGEMAVFRRFGDGDVEFGGGHASALHLFPGESAFGGERLERAGDGVAVGSGVGKRSN